MNKKNTTKTLHDIFGQLQLLKCTTNQKYLKNKTIFYFITIQGSPQSSVYQSMFYVLFSIHRMFCFYSLNLVWSPATNCLLWQLPSYSEFWELNKINVTDINYDLAYFRYLVGVLLQTCRPACTLMTVLHILHPECCHIFHSVYAGLIFGQLRESGHHTINTGTRLPDWMTSYWHVVCLQQWPILMLPVSSFVISFQKKKKDYKMDMSICCCCEV